MKAHGREHTAYTAKPAPRPFLPTNQPAATDKPPQPILPHILQVTSTSCGRRRACKYCDSKSTQRCDCCLAWLMTADNKQLPGMSAAPWLMVSLHAADIKVNQPVLAIITVILASSHNRCINNRTNRRADTVSRQHKRCAAARQKNCKIIAGLACRPCLVQRVALSDRRHHAICA